MRHWKPFMRLTRPATSLAALIVLLGIGAGAGPAQSPSPAPSPAPTVQATASSSPSAAQEDIRDIRPPIHIPYGWLWAAYVAGGIALAGLSLTLWRWRQRHAHSRRKLLYELTLEQLEAVRMLMEPGKGYQFSLAVSEIVRDYIERRFGARAAHRTTQEFLHDLLNESHAALLAHKPLLADFLEHCDLAKFARWHLSVPQMETMYQSARTFVIETGKPAAAAVAAPAATVPQALLIEPRSL
jgi:hypothetical protein